MNADFKLVRFKSSRFKIKLMKDGFGGNLEFAQKCKFIFVRGLSSYSAIHVPFEAPKEEDYRLCRARL